MTSQKENWSVTGQGHILREIKSELTDLAHISWVYLFISECIA